MLYKSIYEILSNGLVIPTDAISTLDSVGSRVPLERGQHHPQCDSKLRKGNAWKGGDGIRCEWRECHHEIATIECLTIKNQENIRQDHRPVVHRNETRPLSRQWPHRGLEPSLEHFPYSAFCLCYIQKMGFAFGDPLFSGA